MVHKSVVRVVRMCCARTKFGVARIVNREHRTTYFHFPASLWSVYLAFSVFSIFLYALRMIALKNDILRASGVLRGTT